MRSRWSPWASVVLLALTLVPAGHAQTGLVVAAQAGQLTLSWLLPAPSTATALLVERSAGGNVCVFTPVASLDLVETWTDTPVAAGQTWCYRVRASDGTQTSPPSNVACGTATGPPPTSVSQTFIRVDKTTDPFTVSVGEYACVRVVGGTAQARILRGATVLKTVALPNPQAGVPFTITCEVTATQVIWTLDHVVKLTVAR